MWQVSLTTSSDQEEAVVHCLETILQIPAAIYVDALKGKTTATVYPSTLRRAPAVITRELKEALRQFPSGPVRVRLTLKKLPRENWAESWKRHFKPMEIGRHLLIKPGWSRRRPLPGQRVILLDPGLSFGTGHHATTSFCLEQLTACRLPRTPQSLLDIGTGSGILAIAAAKLGYSPVAAFDFDATAVRVSRENARRNRVRDRVQPRRQDLTRLPLASRQQWDVICANLMADLLAQEAEKICLRLKPGGNLVIAGVLKREFRRIRDIFVNFRLTLADSVVTREWQSGRFLRLPGISDTQ